MLIQCAPINVMHVFALIACGSMGLGSMSELPPAPNEYILKIFDHFLKMYVFVIVCLFSAI